MVNLSLLHYFIAHVDRGLIIGVDPHTKLDFERLTSWGYIFLYEYGLAPGTINLYSASASHQHLDYIGNFINAC